MIRSAHRITIFLCSLLLAFAAGAQDSKDDPKQSQVIISIYHVAPGKHLDFLKWMAARDAVANEAGVGASQWYAHVDGDSWDYIGISPVTTDEQDEKIDALSKAKGLKIGFQAGLELRTMMASHTDTFARGPISAADLVEAASK